MWSQKKDGRKVEIEEGREERRKRCSCSLLLFHSGLFLDAYTHYDTADVTSTAYL